MPSFAPWRGATLIIPSTGGGVVTLSFLCLEDPGGC